MEKNSAEIDEPKYFGKNAGAEEREKENPLWQMTFKSLGLKGHVSISNRLRKYPSHTISSLKLNPFFFSLITSSP
jgi:hypothetical protein